MDKLYEESVLKRIKFHKERIELSKANISVSKANINRLEEEIKEHIQYLEKAQKELETFNEGRK